MRRIGPFQSSSSGISILAQALGFEMSLRRDKRQPTLG
jgi:hypothetical protein